jgi:hypothetical protein
VTELPRPRTHDEEILEADAADVASLLTDFERIQRITGELQAGFHALSELGPAAVVFGSARTTQDDPWYATAREVGRLLGEAGFAVITGGGPGIMEAANRGAVEALSSLYFGWFFTRMDRHLLTGLTTTQIGQPPQSFCNSPIF